MEVSHIISNWPKFQFSAFETKTAACQVYQYDIVSQMTIFPTLTNFCERSDCLSVPSGTISSGIFTLNVLDGENPAAYYFTIKITTTGGF